MGRIASKIQPGQIFSDSKIRSDQELLLQNLVLRLWRVYDTATEYKTTLDLKLWMLFLDFTTGFRRTQNRWFATRHPVNTQTPSQDWV
eukprot:3255939-Rhodomonas_salina.1